MDRIKTTKRVYFKVITPTNSFADITGRDFEDGKGYVELKTIEQALQAKKDFGSSKSSEHRKYWAEQGAKCRIVRVTEIVEEDNTSVRDYYNEHSELLEALKKAIPILKRDANGLPTVQYLGARDLIEKLS